MSSSLLPSLPFDIGVQPVQTGLEPATFLPSTANASVDRRVRRVRSHGRLDGRPRFHDGPSFPDPGHSRLSDFASICRFHSRTVASCTPSSAAASRDFSRPDATATTASRFSPRGPDRALNLRWPGASSSIHAMSSSPFSIAEHPHGAAEPSAVFEVMVHRGLFLPVRVPPERPRARRERRCARAGPRTTTATRPCWDSRASRITLAAQRSYLMYRSTAPSRCSCCTSRGGSPVRESKKTSPPPV